MTYKKQFSIIKGHILYVHYLMKPKFTTFICTVHIYLCHQNHSLHTFQIFYFHFKICLTRIKNVNNNKKISNFDCKTILNLSVATESMDTLHW